MSAPAHRVPGGSLALSGERLAAVYRLAAADEAGAREEARAIAVEQTIEFPADLVAAGDIRDHVVGRVESLRCIDEGGATDRYEATISYAVEVAGGRSAGAELTQLLNLVFGNVSLKPGIRLERLELPPAILDRLRGPRFGRDGLRRRLAAPERPLLATAVKPMGLSCRELAGLAYRFALGGIDVVKDDHGLTDQSFAPFRERVERCVAAVERANRETGGRTFYMPNVTAPANELLERALFARRAGAGGLLVAPGLVGLDSLRRLADDERVDLPIMAHPSWLGGFLASPASGISHGVLLGQLPRLAGADATIFPSWGGRFPFTRGGCRAIAAATGAPLGGLRPIFPVPAGGMSLGSVPEMLAVYGRELIFLIGGGLHRHGPDLVESCRHFRRLVEGL